MTDYTSPFQLTADTHCLALTATVLAASVSLAGFDDIYVYNEAASDAVFLAFHPVSATAKANAVEPTAGTPKKVVVIPPATAMVLRVPKNSYVNGLYKATKSGNVYITEGRGR